MAIRLLRAAPFVAWTVVAVWAIGPLRAAHVRFEGAIDVPASSSSAGSSMDPAVADRIGWTIAWPQHAAEISIVLAVAAACLFVLARRSTTWWTLLFVASLLGAIVWVMGLGTLAVGLARPWVSPALVHGVTWGSGAVIATLAVVSFLMVRRRPDPLTPEYDRYTLGAAGLPFNRSGHSED